MTRKERLSLGAVTSIFLSAIACASLENLSSGPPSVPNEAGTVDVGAPDDATVDGNPPDVADANADANANANGRDASLACEAQDGGLFEGHCYFTLAPATLEAAIAACAARGAHLATLATSGEHAFVIKRWVDYAWIGLRANPPSNDKSQFAWITGEPVSFTAWYPLDPNENSGCVAVLPAASLWFDRPCTNSYAPLCEID